MVVGGFAVVVPAVDVVEVVGSSGAAVGSSFWVVGGLAVVVPTVDVVEVVGSSTA